MGKVYKGIRIDEDLVAAANAVRLKDESESDVYRRLISAGLELQETSQTEHDADVDVWNSYLDEVREMMKEPPELDDLPGELEHLESWRATALERWQTPEDYFGYFMTVRHLLTSRRLLDSGPDKIAAAEVLRHGRFSRVGDPDWKRFYSRSKEPQPMRTCCFKWEDGEFLIREYFLDWLDYDLKYDGQLETPEIRSCVIAYQTVRPLKIQTMDDLLVTLARLNLDRDSRFFDPECSFDLGCLRKPGYTLPDFIESDTMH